MRRFVAGVIRGDFNEPLVMLAMLALVVVTCWVVPWQVSLGLVLLFVVFTALGFALDRIAKGLRGWADANAK